MMNRKGFTLIELLIVVVIIGILAAIAIPKFATTKDKAKLASVKTDLRNYMTAQEAYFSDKATYGTAAQLPAPGTTSPSRPATRPPRAPAWRGGYSLTARTPASRPAPLRARPGRHRGRGAPPDDGVIKCP